MQNPTYEQLMQRVMQLEKVASKHKQTEEVLSLAKERYETLFKTIAEGVAHYRGVYRRGKLRDLLVLDINPVGARLSGVPREIQIGKTWMKVWPNADRRVFAIYQKVDETGQPVQFENDNKLTGCVYLVLVSKAGSGEFVVTFNDITECKQLE